MILNQWPYIKYIYTEYVIANTEKYCETANWQITYAYGIIKNTIYLT